MPLLKTTLEVLLDCSQKFPFLILKVLFISKYSLRILLVSQVKLPHSMFSMVLEGELSDKVRPFGDRGMIQDGTVRECTGPSSLEWQFSSQ